MKKICLNIVLVLGMFFCLCSEVDAAIINSRKSFNNNDININFMEGDEIGSVDCNGIFTAEALDLISEILNYFRILGPVALIVLTGVDFGSAVLSQDNDNIKKATGKVTKRALATAALFFVPTFVRVAINLPGVRDTIQIPSDPLCGTMDSYIDENQILVK